jgi:uncharacterized protein (TIGR02266 family)
MAKKQSKGKTTGAPAGKARKTTASTSDVTPAKRGTADDRVNNRVPIQLLVDYKADGHYLFDFCKDLGTGGVFIQTDSPLGMGANIDLTFTIPDSKETLVTKGTVIWVQKAVAERKDLTPGMGVQFAGFTSDQRRTLEDFVQRYHKSSDAPTPIKSAKRAG